MGKIIHFLRPDWKKLVLFGVLVFIAYAGFVQSWVFSGKDAGLPKPFLYDLLNPIPFWPIWMYLITPIFILTGGTLNFAPPWIFWIVNFVYFYLVCCAVVFFIERMSKNRAAKLPPSYGT